MLQRKRERLLVQLVAVNEVLSHLWVFGVHRLAQQLDQPLFGASHSVIERITQLLTQPFLIAVISQVMVGIPTIPANRTDTGRPPPLAAPRPPACVVIRIVGIPLALTHSRVAVSGQCVPVDLGYALGQRLEVDDVKALLVTVLRVVAHRYVGALRDDVDELGSVGIHTCVVGQVHQCHVLVECKGQGVSKRIRAATPTALVCDDAVDTTAVERNSPVELGKPVLPVVSQPRSTNAAALLALREDVVGGYTAVQ